MVGAAALVSAALRRLVEHRNAFGPDHAQHFLAAVPEPHTLILAGVAACAVLSRRRRA
jgi:hypothetical protein